MVFDVITVGTATQDVFLNVDFLAQKGHALLVATGRKFEIEKPLHETGGGATNAAVGFARLGLRTAVVTKVGHDDAGHLIKRGLEREGVATAFVIEDKRAGTAQSFILWKRGKDRAVFVYRGAANDLEVQDVLSKRLQARWLYVCALAGGSVKVLRSLLEDAKRHGMKIAYNPGARELRMPGLLQYADVLLVNKEEAELLAGQKGSVARVVQKLASYGPRAIVVTDGPGPIIAYANGRMYHARPFRARIETTLGAGDAFASGFVAGMIVGKPVVEALKWGCLNAASVVQHVGAKVNLLRKGDLGAFERSLRQKFEVRSDD